MTMRDLLTLLPEAQRATILSRGRRRAFPRRTIVMHVGDPADALHLILKGHLGIRVMTPRGDEATIGVRGSGEVVGELALVGEEPQQRSATVVALSDAETLAVHRTQFDALVAAVPEVSGWLTELLAERLRETSAMLRDALFEPADVRLLRRLLDAADRFGTQAVPLTQDDLAAMAGTTRPTVNRTLNDIADRGWVELSRGKVRLLDAPAIRRRAGVAGDGWAG